MRPLIQRIGKSLVFLTLFILGIIIFTFLFYTGYYVYQIKSGHAGNIESAFEKKFTSDTSASGVPTTATDVSHVIRAHNPQIGEELAPITIIMFKDFECPFCQDAYPIFKGVTERYEGAVRVVFKQFPIALVHPHAEAAARSAQCAQEQGLFWPFYDRVYIGKDVSESALTGYAKDLGLQMDVWDACLKKANISTEIREDYEDGLSLGVRGTPTYFLNGQKIEGVIDGKTWDALILDALNHTP